ncbi:MAG: elongation factor G [Bacteroidia bacterium]
MKQYKTNEIKNVALVGGSKSGKTTLAECMMFESGVLSRMGSVDDGNTVSDFHEIEIERKNSIFSSVMHSEWRGTKINLIDTPGMDDFVGELISSLRVCDTALLTLNAQNGVEVGTEIAWRSLKKHNTPTILVVNQLDHSKADFNVTLEQAQKQFGSGVVIIQYPYNDGEGFNSIIDLLKNIMYKFPAGGGKPEKVPIPADQADLAEERRAALIEAAAEHDETLMDTYFENGELTEDEIRKGLGIGISNRDLFPLFCVSAKQNMGTGRLMGFLGNVAKSPGEMGGETTVDGEELPITDPTTTLFVFKASNEKHTGAMSYFKVCSGEVKAGMELVNLNTGNKEKINQLFTLDGKNRIPIDALSAGDIGVTVKLKDTGANQTLRSKDDGKIIAPIEFPNPKNRAAVLTTKLGDEEKLGLALNKMASGDPTLHHEYRKELKQTILSGQGDLHLQIIRWTLDHIYGVQVEYGVPRISYRETIQKPAEGYYKHKKQSGGSGQYGEVYLRIAPYYEGYSDPGDLKVREKQEIDLDWGGKLLYCNCIVGGVIDTRFMPAILKGIMETMEEGPITGSYARDIIVYVYDGKMHAVDSNEISFKIAGKQAFKQAFLAANPKLLEPVYKIDVLVPEENMGDVMTDLQQRRGIVQGFSNEGNYQRITAHVPLAELYKYSTSLSSISQGRATHEREFLEYSTVPGDVQQKLAQEHKPEKEVV